MKTSSLLRSLVSLVAVAPGAGLLAGCGLPARPPLTVAATATSAEPAPTIEAIADVLVEHAAAALLPEQGAVTVVTQGHPAGSVDLTPMRGVEVEADQNRVVAAIGGRLPEVADRLNRGATTDGIDTLGVLDAAVQVTPVGGRILVLSSGISAVAPVDLRAAGDWLLDPDGLVVPRDDERAQLRVLGKIWRSTPRTVTSGRGSRARTPRPLRSILTVQHPTRVG